MGEKKRYQQPAIVTEMDVAQIKAMQQVREALLGDEWTQEKTPELSPLQTIKMLLNAYEREHDWLSDRDPDATREMVAEARQALSRVEQAFHADTA